MASAEPDPGLPGRQATRLSMAMSKLLRHKPPPEMDASGFVPLPVLLRCLGDVPGASEAAVRAIVAADKKGRFQLDDSSAPPRVRAVQGHSVALAAPLLRLVSPHDPGDLPAVVVHATSEDGWQAIQASGELRRMSRTHIHFSTQPGHMRANRWATVLLRLDLPRALGDGHAFATAENGVLLCEGPLPVAYVRRVERAELPEEWAAAR